MLPINVAALCAISGIAVCAAPRDVSSQPAHSRVAGVVDSPVLEIGDTAPALSIKQWLKGEPITIEPGKVYVIEFWASWCVPSRRAIPKLTDIQKQFESSGVKVVAVASQEHKDISGLQQFIARLGDGLGFAVAWDDEGRTARDWLRATQTDRIPSAFVVDAEGRIAWIGHPLMGLDRAIEQVLAGTIDLEVEAVLARRLREVRAQTQPLAAAFLEAERTGDDDKALAIVDEILRLDPRINGAWSLAKFKLLAIRMKDPERAFTFARQCVELNINQRPDDLLDLANFILDQPALAKRDPMLTLRASRRALQLMGQNSPVAHAVLARALLVSGDRDGAVSHQMQAVALTSPGPEQELQEKLLESYRQTVEE